MSTTQGTETGLTSGIGKVVPRMPKLSCAKTAHCSLFGNLAEMADGFAIGLLSGFVGRCYDVSQSLAPCFLFCGIAVLLA